MINILKNFLCGGLMLLLCKMAIPFNDFLQSQVVGLAGTAKLMGCIGIIVVMIPIAWGLGKVAARFSK